MGVLGGINQNAKPQHPGGSGDAQCKKKPRCKTVTILMDAISLHTDIWHATLCQTPEDCNWCGILGRDIQAVMSLKSEIQAIENTTTQGPSSLPCPSAVRGDFPWMGVFDGQKCFLGGGGGGTTGVLSDHCFFNGAAAGQYLRTVTGQAASVDHRPGRSLTEKKKKNSGFGQPPDTLPSDTRLHRLLVALLGIQVQVNAPLHAQLWDDHHHVSLGQLQSVGVWAPTIVWMSEPPANAYWQWAQASPAPLVTVTTTLPPWPWIAIAPAAVAKFKYPAECVAHRCPGHRNKGPLY